MVWLTVLLAAFASAATSRAEAPKYDAATFTRVSGFIVDVRDAGAPAVLRGVYVTLRADKRDIEIYLCPAEFLQRFDLKLSRGENMQVSGSRVKYAGADLLLAREMRRHNDILVLRDEEGNPYWEDQT